MNIMQTLTLNGKTYDSFKDKTAVHSINHMQPNSKGEISLDSDFSGEAKKLLITILENISYVEDQSTNIQLLKNILQIPYDHTPPELHPNGVIPEGATYSTGAYQLIGDKYDERNDPAYSYRWHMTSMTTYQAGTAFPSTVKPGDVYRYQDYEYCYSGTWTGTEWHGNHAKWDDPLKGWGVRVLDKTKTEYSPILETINDKEIMRIDNLYRDCTSLLSTNGLGIPEGVVTLNSVFYNCTALQNATNFIIPTTVHSINSIFSNCTALTGALVIHTTPDNYNYALFNTQIQTIYGNCQNKTEILATKTE